MSTVKVPPARLSFLGIVYSQRPLTLRECRLASALASLWHRDGGFLSDVPVISDMVYAARCRLHERAENRALIRAAMRENPSAVPGCGSFWMEGVR